MKFIRLILTSLCLVSVAAADDHSERGAVLAEALLHSTARMFVGTDQSYTSKRFRAMAELALKNGDYSQLVYDLHATEVQPKKWITAPPASKGAPLILLGPGLIPQIAGEGETTDDFGAESIRGEKGRWLFVVVPATESATLKKSRALAHAYRDKIVKAGEPVAPFTNASVYQIDPSSQIDRRIASAELTDVTSLSKILLASKTKKKGERIPERSDLMKVVHTPLGREIAGLLADKLQRNLAGPAASRRSVPRRSGHD